MPTHCRPSASMACWCIACKSVCRLPANGFAPDASAIRRPAPSSNFTVRTGLPSGHVNVGPWTGSFDWKQVTQEMDVPPAARLAVIGIGLFGATGELSVDQVSVEAR